MDVFVAMANSSPNMLGPRCTHHYWSDVPIEILRVTAVSRGESKFEGLVCVLGIPYAGRHQGRADTEPMSGTHTRNNMRGNLKI